jgi:hypothetical protein
MTAGKVAVPYYGRLHRDKLGYERIFFIVEAGSGLEKDLDVSLGVWDHSLEQSLPDWLCHNGVSTLACKEEPEQHLKKKMARLGINILNERNNDASTLMKTLMV